MIDEDIEQEESDSQPEIKFTDDDRKAAYIQSTGPMRELLMARKEPTQKKTMDSG